MDLIKYCKKEHNIRLGCPTIQLGTFDYYRTLDPTFLIADAEEGYIKYTCKPDKNLLIDSRQFNAIAGGAVLITDKDSPNPTKSLGSVKLKMDGGEYIGQDDGSILIKPGTIESEVFYPNSYIFCCSIFENDDKVDPKIIDENYNSYYKIPGKNIEDFANKMCQLLSQTLTIGNIKIENEKILESHLLTLGQAPNVKCIHGPVEYVEDKTILLKDPKDFEENGWTRIFYQSMFKKSKEHESDNEYRFVFIIEHAVHRILPVVKDPKIIKLNPIYDLLK